MWEQDLKFGEEGERFISGILNARKVDWRDGYDLNYKGKKIEVKRDRRAKATGNLCFEDSLLNQSVDYMIFLVEGTEDIYVFTKKECVEEMRKGHKIWFENKKYIYLVNRCLLKKYKKTIEELKKF